MLYFTNKKLFYYMSVKKSNYTGDDSLLFFNIKIFSINPAIAVNSEIKQLFSDFGKKPEKIFKTLTANRRLEFASLGRT